MKKKLPVPEHMDTDGTVKEANRGRRRSALKRFDIRRDRDCALWSRLPPLESKCSSVSI